EIRRVGEPQSSGIECANNVEVFPGKTTEVACRVPPRYQTPAVACFSPNAEISLAERNVLPDAYVPLSANVQGGRNYGELSFDWKASAEKINSVVSATRRDIYSLDTTGVAPGTIINLSLRVTSSLGNCLATAQSSTRIMPPPPTPTPTPVPTPTPTLMPDLVG